MADFSKISESFVTLSSVFNWMGENEPYFSVLTDPKYLMKNISEDNISEFYARGESDVRYMLELLSVNDISISFDRAFDFGCGVGRVSIPMAKYFGHVTGCDISKGNLKVAEEKARAFGVSNVTFAESEFDLLQQFGEGQYDCVHSLIVLQHMIHPLMKMYIVQFLKLLKRGGIAFFQLPTSCREYAYNDMTLDASIKNMSIQLHCLGFRDVLKIINDENCRLIDITNRDYVGPGWNSHDFLILKP